MMIQISKMNCGRLHFESQKGRSGGPFLSHIIRVRERKRKSDFKTHPYLLKFARVKVESTGILQGLRVRAHDIFERLRD